MITQVCNLSCQGCTNYSDLRHQGYVPWIQGKQWLEKWLDRIDIAEFGIMGGEPLVNPEWRDWIYGVRKLIPTAPIRFTTNGLMLHRVPDILAVMEEVGNVVFKITVHVNDHELESQIQQIHSSRKWAPITEFGINRWVSENNVKLQVNRPTEFVATFKGTYNNMQPWHSNPTQAFKQCIQKTCPLLHQGKIYKCSTAGLLSEVLDRFNRPNYAEWEQYIDNGITVNDTEPSIAEFIKNFGKPSAICAQCPTHGNALNHIMTVVRK
jgi:organic radical activating enzyme